MATLGDYPARTAIPLNIEPESGQQAIMLTNWLSRIGIRGWHLHSLSISAVGLCVVLWLRGKTVDQSERGNVERRALFVGLWPPTLWLIGDSLERHE